MSTATATAYRNNCTGRFMSSRIRKSPQNKAFYGHKGTYSGKAHCIKDSVLLDETCGSGGLYSSGFNKFAKITRPLMKHQIKRKGCE